MIINIFGDFVCPPHKTPKFDDKLTAFIKEADYNVVNFEAPVITPFATQIEKSGPCLCQSTQAPQFLENLGFNIIALANNHIYDYGESAAISTINSFKKAKTIGLGNINTAYAPLIIEQSGIKVGLINLTHFEFGTLSNETLDPDLIGSAWISSIKVESLIRDTKDKVDYLIVLPHAGIENITQPLPEWRNYYRHFIDIGADIIVASHPHIVQGVEIYKDKPIYFSIGNFYFPWTGVESVPNTWHYGMAIQLNISKEGIVPRSLFFSFNDDQIIENDKARSLFLSSSEILANNSVYIQTVNNECSQLQKEYTSLFYLSGYLHIGSKGWILRLIKLILHRTKISNTHLLNNLRCESHRFAISRLLTNL